MTLNGQPLHGIVVGGSLAGLATTLALARVGVEVTLIERTGPRPRSGGAIGVNQDHLERVTGIPAVDTARGAPAPESWAGLHARMRRAVAASDRVRIIDRTTVTHVDQDSSGVRVVSDENEFSADFAIGADGHRSVVRRAVAPEHPDASFAGYVLWLGITGESDLPSRASWPQDADIVDGRDAVLIGYPLEGEDGRRTPGSRRLGWAWFDPTRNDVLRQQGALRDGVVMHSIRPPDVPAQTLAELDDASSQWPEPWRTAIRRSIRSRSVTGTPIAEYVPRRIVNGRIALVGNAAHVPTPMTGRGFDTSLDDAASVAEAMRGRSASEVGRALQGYEFERLEPGRDMVQSGQSFSRWFSKQ